MRKIATLLALALILSLALAGCAGDATQDKSTDATSITVGLQSDWMTMDPAYGYEVFANLYFYAVYENLYKLEGSNLDTPKPCLAESYSIDESGKVFTFTLNPAAKFSSGNPVTSADVVFSVNRVRNVKSNTTLHTDIVSDITAPDEKTVVFTLKEKDASFLSKICTNSYAIVDSKIVKEQGGTDAADASTADKAQKWLDSNSAGSGPYILKSYVSKTELILEKNPNYWGTPANVDKIIFKEIPDVNSQLQMLQTGEIDIAMDLGPDQISAIKDKPGIKIISEPTSTTSFLCMNDDAQLAGPIANKKVQQAIKYAIDYDGLLSLAGDGSKLPISNVCEGFLGAKFKDAGFRDLEKAKALLTEAGYPDGFETTLTAAAGSSEGLGWDTIAMKVKEDLAEVGINVKIVSGDFTGVINEYREGKVPFLVMHWSPDYYDLNDRLVFMPGDKVGLRANWTADNEAELVELSKQISMEMDVAKRTEMSQKMQDLIFERSPFAFLVQHPKMLATTDRLDNVFYNDLCRIQLAPIKIVK